MIQNGNGTSSCERASLIPEYIYQELNEKSRLEFERHYAECAPCSAELNGMANAHLAVMQWRDEAFASLPTPKFVIPYREDRPAFAEPATLGWAASLRQLPGRFSTFQWGAGLAAVAAAILIVFVGVSIIRQSNQPVVAVNDAAHVVDTTSAGEQRDPEKAGIDNKDRVPNETTVAANPKPSERNRGGNRSRTISGVARKSVPQPGNVADASRKLVLPHRKLPALNDVADDEDNTLRLSELFDQIGS